MIPPPPQRNKENPLIAGRELRNTGGERAYSRGEEVLDGKTFHVNENLILRGTSSGGGKSKPERERKIYKKIFIGRKELGVITAVN